MMKVAILGAGGHARVIASVIDAAHRAGQNITLAGFVSPAKDDAKAQQWLGADSDLSRLREAGIIDSFIVGVGSTHANNQLRVRLFELGLAAGLQAETIIHPTAIIAPDTTIDKGAVIMAGAILNTGVQIGSNAIINTGAIIDHDSKIGDHSHVAPGAVLSGDVSIGSLALIGVGASIMQSCKIGNQVTIGAGAVIISDIPSGTVAVGNPGRTASATQ